MKKIKKRDIFVMSEVLSDDFFVFSVYTVKQELLCRFTYNFHAMNSMHNLIADNVQVVTDDINRFLLMKNYALADKALFYIENELFNIFNGYSLDFKNS